MFRCNWQNDQLTRWMGADGKVSFKDFELKLKVMATTKANGGGHSAESGELSRSLDGSQIG